MSDFTGMMLPSDITKCESTCPQLTMLNAKKGKMWYNYNMIYLHIKQKCSFTLAFIVSTYSILLVWLFRMARIIMHNCVKFTEGYIMYIRMIDI